MGIVCCMSGLSASVVEPCASHVQRIRQVSESKLHEQRIRQVSESELHDCADQSAAAVGSGQAIWSMGIRSEVQGGAMASLLAARALLLPSRIQLTRHRELSSFAQLAVPPARCHSCASMLQPARESQSSARRQHCSRGLLLTMGPQLSAASTRSV